MHITDGTLSCVRGKVQRRAAPRRSNPLRPLASPPCAGSVDLVTETDKLCEEIIYSQLRTAFPEHAFIGEEGSASQGFTDELTDAPTWLVDPIDGAF